MPGRSITKGDIKQGFPSSDHTIEGEIHIGPQEHFYLEPQVAIVTPKEDGEIEILVSTQSPRMVQVSCTLCCLLCFSVYFEQPKKKNQKNQTWFAIESIKNCFQWCGILEKRSLSHLQFSILSNFQSFSVTSCSYTGNIWKPSDC